MTPPNIQRKQSGIKNIIETLNDEQNSESEQYGFIQQRSQTDRVRSRMYQSPMQLNSEDSPPKADTAPLSLNAFRSLEEDFLSQIVGTPSRKSGEG
ncbi:MAG: hypothetical protein EZS28_008813 [Streblomastix strix]|uniref:Uncharacterized protein n=1 Tax=Streblomastix strix TaxID=222440 RepID=A0A5J4WM76_9EUKA|nr:MAG: hypothetical protein EZS28_008813 [Streblomastix strix]